MPAKPKRLGFYCELPVTTIREIKRRAYGGRKQWQVIESAIEGSTWAYRIRKPALHLYNGPRRKKTEAVSRHHAKLIRKFSK